MLRDEPLECGHEVLVVGLDQFSTNVNDERLPAVLFLELDGHVNSIDSIA